MLRIFMVLAVLCGPLPTLPAAAPVHEMPENAHSHMCADGVIERLKRSANRGDVKAQYHLAMIFGHALCGTADIERAIHFLRPAADRGHAGAAFELGLLHLDSAVVQADAGIAEKYFRIAAKQDHPEAQHRFDISVLWRASTADERFEALY